LNPLAVIEQRLEIIIFKELLETKNELNYKVFYSIRRDILAGWDKLLAIPEINPDIPSSEISLKLY